jgi:hypothetical protein
MLGVYDVGARRLCFLLYGARFLLFHLKESLRAPTQNEVDFPQNITVIYFVTLALDQKCFCNFLNDLTGVNSPPVVSNLDQSIIVPETVTVGTVIFTALVSDANNDPLTYQYEYSPVETTSKFTMEEASKFWYIE